MLLESKYLADFLVGFLGKKPQTLLSTTILYDTLSNLRTQNATPEFSEKKLGVQYRSVFRGWYA